MNLSLDSLKRYGVGSRALTEKDFYRICEAEGIEIVWSDKKYSFFFSAGDVSCIVLPKRLKGLRLLFAMLHELAHFWISPGHPVEVQWQDMHDGKDEAMCDAIALISIIPVARLKDGLDGSRYASKLYADRLRLWFLYGV